MRTKIGLVAAAVAAGAGVLMTAAPAVAASAPLPSQCRAYYSPYDPDEGAGAGKSNCGPNDLFYHRVKLTCDGPSWDYNAYGDWVWSTYDSSTTCYGGHHAYAVTYETR